MLFLEKMMKMMTMMEDKISPKVKKILSGLIYLKNK